MTAHTILKQYFGYDEFRGGQEALINDILAGRDVLGIMPTGAGKSLCFQIPALMMPGLTLIISPLISLMKDQVNALIQSGVAAAFINSSLTERQINKALHNASNNVYKLIYIAPERLLSGDFLDFARYAQISMLTVDEAHCISQWGHDFRPSYAKIPDFMAYLHSRPVVSAFTATATPRVKEDIISLLRLKNPSIVNTGFDRPNLYFTVKKPKKKFAALLDFLADKKDLSGIVYCSTRTAVEDVCEKLQQNGYNASRYHAGLADNERRDNQDDFIYDRVQIMVATNAFGMGIDKSNVSYVLHYNMPKDIESYYQEAGRAGRDGEPADCLLLFNGQDIRTNQWLIENGREAKEPADGVLTAQIIERDRARLREMTFYCETNDCLRRYILKYFGEEAPEQCGNCGNCVAVFETVDVTVPAQKILSCVARMEGRYGMKMIIDTLRGSKNEKLLRMRLDKLPTYGICEQSERQLKEIMQYLILNGYLLKTDDEYPVIKLGERANEVLRGGAAVQMKLSEESKRAAAREEKQPLRQLNRQLFATLRELRQEIAKEQDVPAFVIFHDSTLTDMCLKIPRTPADLLEVLGVGQVKANRYGKRFLEAISAFVQNNDISETAAAPPGAFDPAAIEISDEPVPINAIADRINCLLLQGGYKKISGKRINDWLVEQGYLQLTVINGKNFKVATPIGEALGITTEERIIRGEQTKQNFFARPAQEYIVTNVLDILAKAEK